jgi:tungstate transport system substrate-binding protein
VASRILRCRAGFLAIRCLLLALVVGCSVFGAQAQNRFITVASTTSTEQSGLFGYILPIFEKKTGIQVRVVALGAGQALDVGRRGDADVVFVHAKADEEKFMAEGHGVKRFPVMYNDLVLIGPKSDPAKLAWSKGNILEAMKKIAAAEAPFISRGDRSGTHMAELELWKDAHINIDKLKGRWYREAGQGMGPALMTAAWSGAYILADRATWLAFKNRGDLAILVEGVKRLFNQYGVILVNPAKHPNVKNELGQTFVDWVISPEGQKAIADYKIDGQQLFFPNANQPGA